MEFLDLYEESLQSIHDYFGYKEDWVVIPISDRREYYWLHTPHSKDVPSEESSGHVTYSSNRENLIKYISFERYGIGEYHDGEDIYEDVIYTQRFLPKYVFVGEEYTMISVDTRTDGNKFLAIFSNEKGLSLSELDSAA